MEERRAPGESGFFTRQEVPEAPGRGRVAKLRNIARAGSPMCVEGHPVDPTEASTAIAVYDALSGPAARHALMSPLDVSKVLDWSRALSSGRPARRTA